MASTTSRYNIEAIKNAVAEIPDFPKPGILFKDIMPILREPQLFKETIEYFAHHLEDISVDYIAGIESRGFLLGVPLAQKLGVGFIPIRKKGKLPGEVEQFEYELEYGTDCVEIQKNALTPGTKVVLIDDLLATGGTASASVELLKKTGADVAGILFLIELTFLNGKEKLPQGTLFHAMIQY